MLLHQERAKATRHCVRVQGEAEVTADDREPVKKSAASRGRLWRVVTESGMLRG